MKKYFRVNDITHIADFDSIIEEEYANGKREGKTNVYVYDGFEWKNHFLSVYYRHERTWDDHMGNTPCGYYVNIPIGKGKTKRVYMF